MGFEDIESKVRDKSRRQVEEIKAKTREEVSKIKSQLDQDAVDRCEKIRADCEKKSSTLRRSIVSTARLKALNKVAIEKARAIEGVFKSAKESVLNLPSDRKKKLLSKMLEDKSLIEGKVTVLIDKKYAGLLLKANGVEVKTQKMDDFGFIISSKDGMVWVDKRLDAVLDGISEKIKPDLCSILFNET